jgi:hypothetical protein
LSTNELIEKRRWKVVLNERTEGEGEAEEGKVQLQSADLQVRQE